MSRLAWFVLGAAVAGASYAAVIAVSVVADRRHLAQLHPAPARRPVPTTESFDPMTTVGAAVTAILLAPGA